MTAAQGAAAEPFSHQKRVIPFMFLVSSFHFALDARPRLGEIHPAMAKNSYQTYTEATPIETYRLGALDGAVEVS